MHCNLFLFLIFFFNPMVNMCTVQERAILDEAEEWENEELKEAVGIHCGDFVAAHYTSVGQ